MFKALDLPGVWDPCVSFFYFRPLRQIVQGMRWICATDCSGCVPVHLSRNRGSSCTISRSMEPPWIRKCWFSILNVDVWARNLVFCVDETRASVTKYWFLLIKMSGRAAGTIRGYGNWHLKGGDSTGGLTKIWDQIAGNILHPCSH